MKQSIIDLTELVLVCLCQTVGPHMVDYNISIGMLCRIIFFIFSITLRDVRSFTWSELWYQIGAWAMFHLFVICFEYEYLFKGKSQTVKREARYKIFDTLQSGIGIIYSIYNLDSYYYYIFIGFFSLNCLDNIIGLLIYWRQKEKPQNHVQEGGIMEFFIGLTLGSLAVSGYLITIIVLYWFEIQEIKNLLFYLFLTVVGELIISVFSCCFIQYKENSQKIKFSKQMLGLSYGLNFGLFSIFYGFLIGLFIFITSIILCLRNSTSSSQVHTITE
ncbi:unnamed protein product [Paramecium octaurelia]|uniref:Uncharacterized protein n=1 Tax=Paramecium octaurelia TaxID=43137 RepID=A0A8S1WTX9_PAROT|nr:unnamed protein product [Paramecium octaurelia]